MDIAATSQLCTESTASPTCLPTWQSCSFPFLRCGDCRCLGPAKLVSYLPSLWADCKFSCALTMPWSLTRYARGMIAAIIRTVGFVRADMAKDPTWRAATTTVLTIAESGGYFICACLPYLNPLLRMLYDVLGMAKLFASRSNTGYKRSGSGSLTLAPSRPSKTGYTTDSKKSLPESVGRDGFSSLEMGEQDAVRNYSVVSA